LRTVFKGVFVPDKEYKDRNRKTEQKNQKILNIYFIEKFKQIKHSITLKNTEDIRYYPPYFLV